MSIELEIVCLTGALTFVGVAIWGVLRTIAYELRSLRILLTNTPDPEKREKIPAMLLHRQPGSVTVSPSVLSRMHSDDAA